MKDDPLFFELQIAAEHLEKPIQTDGEPTFILCDVDVAVDVNEYRPKEEQHSEEERINKKFAHNRNMSELL